MKNVDVEAAVATATAIPIRKVMSRAEKLTHWAGLVRASKEPLYIYHEMERWTDKELRASVCHGRQSAFILAATDPVCREQGLPANPTFKEVLGFFDLTQTQLHEFSCDCGGYRSSGQMADRISKIANAGRAAGGGGGMISRAVSALRPW